MRNATPFAPLTGQAGQATRMQWRAYPLARTLHLYDQGDDLGFTVAAGGVRASE